MSLCVVCPQLSKGEPRLYERANVCTGCRSRLAALLVDIADLYTQLPDQLLPGQSPADQRVSGSREAPLPLRVDPLDLTMPARASTVHDPHGDQIGHLSVASTLDSWARDWRHARAVGEHPPTPTVPTLTRWLADRLDWACDHHPAVDEYAGELHHLAAVLRRTCGTNEARPELLDAPCSRCDRRALHRLPGEDRVECGACGRLLTEEEYARWVGLLATSLVD